MKKIVLFFTFLSLGCLAIAQSPDSIIVVSAEKGILSIGKHVYLFEDKEGKLTIEDLQKPEYQKLFKKSQSQTPNFRFTRSKIWVKFTVANELEEQIYLEIGTALAWYIDFYKPNSAGKPVLSTKTGMMRPVKNREVDNNLFLFELPKKTSPQTFYFSIQSDLTLTIPLLLGTAKSLYEHRYPYILFFGMFWGLMLVMLFYNLFVYFSVRDKIYLYYCGYLLVGLFFFNSISSNYGYQWNILTYFSNYFLLPAFLQALFVSLFLLSLLKVKRQQLFFKINVGYLFIMFLFALINLITGRYIGIIGMLDICVSFYCFYVFFYSVSQYRKGNAAARFVAFGFSFYLLGIIIMTLQGGGLLPIHFLTRNAVILGMSIEVVVFSLALADRINIMRKEQVITQANLLTQTQENEKLVREQNLVLVQSVAEKTYDLQTAYTEIQVRNQELSQQKEQLNLANNTKNKLFSIIGHDLRSPVASLESFLELMQTGLISTKEFETHLPYFYSNVKNVQATLSNLLQWSISQMNGINAQPTQVDTQQIIEENVNLFTTVATAKNITLITNAAEVVLVWADENHFRLLLRNLINNAIKFTPKGGQVKITAQPKQTNIEISITDNGVGMTEKQIAKLFEKNQNFTTSGTSGEKGTGLGLQLCQEIVEKNGGEIWVESIENKGSTFTFSLPMAYP